MLLDYLEYHGFMSVQHIDVAQRNRLFRFTQAGAVWTDPRAGEADPKPLTTHPRLGMCSSRASNSLTLLFRSQFAYPKVSK